MNKFDQLVKLIEAGEISSARSSLALLLRRRLNRQQALILAQCARRLIAPDKALKLLHSYVRDDSPERVRTNAKPAEISEYAIALSMFGASQEALKLMDRVSPIAFPINGIHQAMTYIRQWDWPMAEIKFRLLSDQRYLGEKHQFTVRVFLASCQLHGSEDLIGAEKSLSKLISELSKTNFGFLLRSALLLRGQAFCQQGSWQKSESDFLQVLSHAKRYHSPDGIALAEKWLAILGLRRGGGAKAHHLKRLARARDQLQQLNLWERVRGCDLYLAQVTKDNKLISHLRAGSPYPAFQQRLERLFGPEKIGHCRQWLMASSEKSSSLINLDLSTLKHGQVSYRLMLALASDFYRPFTLVELHEKTYPNQYYNPHSSPLKIHQAMTRLRNWFEQEQLPVSIFENRNTYNLTANSPCLITFGPLEKQLRPIIEHMLVKIQKKHPKYFSTQQVIKLLKLPKRTTLHYLAEAIEFGRLQKQGQGKNTHYLFT